MYLRLYQHPILASQGKWKTFNAAWLRGRRALISGIGPCVARHSSTPVADEPYWKPFTSEIPSVSLTIHASHLKRPGLSVCSFSPFSFTSRALESKSGSRGSKINDADLKILPEKIFCWFEKHNLFWSFPLRYLVLATNKNQAKFCHWIFIIYAW